MSIWQLVNDVLVDTNRLIQHGVAALAGYGCSLHLPYHGTNCRLCNHITRPASSYDPLRITYYPTLNDIINEDHVIGRLAVLQSTKTSDLSNLLLHLGFTIAYCRDPNNTLYTVRSHLHSLETGDVLFIYIDSNNCNVIYPSIFEEVRSHNQCVQVVVLLDCNFYVPTVGLCTSYRSGNVAPSKVVIDSAKKRCLSNIVTVVYTAHTSGLGAQRFTSVFRSKDGHVSIGDLLRMSDKGTMELRVDVNHLTKKCEDNLYIFL